MPNAFFEASQECYRIMQVYNAAVVTLGYHDDHVVAYFENLYNEFEDASERLEALKRDHEQTLAYRRDTRWYL